MIKEIILATGVLYLAINGIQVINRAAINMQGLAIGILLLAVSGVFWYGEQEPLKKWEYMTVWGGVLLFVIYGVLTFGGVL
ncbi:MAG TPA: hypothetical protein VMW63_06660 [Methanoregulaceae archaeon]|nr:hypothetical protein [Methanoregulaceae archaeon]